MTTHEEVVAGAKRQMEKAKEYAISVGGIGPALIWLELLREYEYLKAEAGERTSA